MGKILVETKDAEQRQELIDAHLVNPSVDKERDSAKEIESRTMVPMTPLQASATIVNLVLATGPFSYPYGFVGLGPVLSLTLLAITTSVAYVTATFMIEAIAVANALDKSRLGSIFGEDAYKSPMVARKSNLADLDHKHSAYYIRQKIEIGVVAQRIARPWVKNLIMIILVTYMYGAICLKYVSGAQSFAAGVNVTFWPDDGTGFQKWLGFDPYFLGLFIFGFFSTYFSFGNIENAKTLQIVTTLLRFLVTLMMCGGSIYYISAVGGHPSPIFDFKNQLKQLADVFGNTTFAFIYHHSIAGIIYPVRPQKSIKSMFFYSNIVGACFLAVEGVLAWIAFGALTNPCVAPVDWPDDEKFVATYPCATAALYNENFLGINGLG